MCDIGQLLWQQSHTCDVVRKTLDSLSSDQMNTLVCILTPSRYLDTTRIGSLNICQTLLSYLLYKRPVLKSRCCGLEDCERKLDRRVSVPLCWSIHENTGLHLPPGTPLCVNHRRTLCKRTEREECKSIEADERATGEEEVKNRGTPEADEEAATQGENEEEEGREAETRELPDADEEAWPGREKCGSEGEANVGESVKAKKPRFWEQSQSQESSQELWKASQEGVLLFPLTLGSHITGGDNAQAMQLKNRLLQDVLVGSASEKVSSSQIFKTLPFWV